MPFAGITKVLLDYNESTRPLAALFVNLHEKTPKPAMKLDKNKPD